MADVSITVNNKIFKVAAGTRLIDACEIAGVEIPRFCYHKKLEVAGNCRMCLVEVVQPKSPKPVASCAVIVSDNMVVNTNTPVVENARKGVMSFLLANHPLDCPICDQAGSCDLQDQAFVYGSDRSEFHENKRAVEDKNMGPLVATNMTRCIHCKRCTRFMEEIAGSPEIGAFGRGEDMEIATILEKNITSELSGNIIDLCPVGALTSKPFRFTARPWELEKTDSIDVLDAVGSNIQIESRGKEVMRILPRINEDLNEEWISDKTRFSYDGLKMQRIDQAFVKSGSSFAAVSNEEALNAVVKKISKLKGDQIAVITGDMVDLETHYALLKLLNLKGVQYFDCRQKQEHLDTLSRGNYIFNTGIANISKATSLLLVGCNTKVEAPIVNLHIRAGIKNGLKVASIGKQVNLNYDVDYLGNEVSILQKILKGMHEYSQVLKRSELPAVIIGMEALKSEKGTIILELVKHIAKKYNLINNEKGWNGFNVLHNSAALVGALDVGFISEKCQNEGSGAIFENIKQGNIKLVMLFGADEIDQKLLEGATVVYAGSHCDNLANVADIILPSTCYTEKTALYVNTEGRVQSTLKAVPALGSAKDDVEWVIDLANQLEFDLGFKSRDEAVQELFTSNKFLQDCYNKRVAYPIELLSSESELISLPLSKVLLDESKDVNFYMTNSISRLSLTMAKCSTELASCSHE